MKKILYILTACIGLLTSCAKEDDLESVENTEYERLTPGDTKYSYLKVLNLTPGSPVVNYYIDGTKFSASLASSGIENAGYTYNGLFPDFGYAATTPGSHKFTAKIIPTAADANLEVLNTTISPAPGKYYTIYTTGQYSATNKMLGAPFVLEDVKPALDTSKIFVRLVNLAIGLPNIDLVKGPVVTDPKIITNIGYGQASNWVAIPNLGPGTAPIVPLWYINATTGVPLSTAVTNVTLTKGRAYTLYIRGIFGTTGTTAVTTTFYTTFF